MIRVLSCFAQVLAMVDRYGFDCAVRELDAERGAKGFRSWDQFVAVLFCQLGSADSLREICGGLSTAFGANWRLEGNTLFITKGARLSPMLKQKSSAQ